MTLGDFVTINDGGTAVKAANDASTNSQLRKVKTTNMGTLFELTYTVALKKDVNEKNFIDALRVKNGNLNIVLGIPETESTNLN